MIEKIGLRRTLVLVVLLAIIGGLFLLNEFMFRPKVVESQQRLSASVSELGRLQGEVAKMRAAFEVFEKQKVFYETIARMGFFNDQDRVLARERFDTMQKLSKIISARYEIKPANILTDETSADTGFVVMESPITVELSAVDDLDVYRFIYYLNYGFPGHITINALDVERKADVSPALLKEIGTGRPPQIISAKMELDWRTMARKDAILPASVAPATGGGVQ